MALRWKWNRFREPLEPVPAAPDVLAFHQSLSGYGATPLVGYPSAAAALGIAALHVKDESARFGLNAFKALGASWAMSRIAVQSTHLP